MVTAQLWLGVVLLTLGGVFLAYGVKEHVSGRYFAERHSEGATKAFLGLIRWCWAILHAICAIVCFVGAVWLAKFALSQ